MKKPVSKKCILALGILCIVLLGSCWLCKSLFIGTPYYASLVTEGTDSNISVADVRYTGMGTRIGQERFFAMTDGTTIYSVMDYEDTLTARHPMYAYGTPGYTEALIEGTAQEIIGEVSSYGS